MLLLEAKNIIKTFTDRAEPVYALKGVDVRVEQGQVLKDRYTGQLELYARALKQVTGINVRQKLIYSVALHEEIEL